MEKLLFPLSYGANRLLFKLRYFSRYWGIFFMSSLLLVSSGSLSAGICGSKAKRIQPSTVVAASQAFSAGAATDALPASTSCGACGASFSLQYSAVSLRQCGHAFCATCVAAGNNRCTACTRDAMQLGELEEAYESLCLRDEQPLEGHNSGAASVRHPFAANLASDLSHPALPAARMKKCLRCDQVVADAEMAEHCHEAYGPYGCAHTDCFCGTPLGLKSDSELLDVPISVAALKDEIAIAEYCNHAFHRRCFDAAAERGILCAFCNRKKIDAAVINRFHNAIWRAHSGSIGHMLRSLTLPVDRMRLCATPNRAGTRALKWAVARGDLSVVSALIENFSTEDRTELLEKSNQHGLTRLIVAANKGL